MIINKDRALGRFQVVTEESRRKKQTDRAAARWRTKKGTVTKDSKGNTLVYREDLARMLTNETDLTTRQSTKAISALNGIIKRLMSEGSKVKVCGVTFATAGERVHLTLSSDMKGKE